MNDIAGYGTAVLFMQHIRKVDIPSKLKTSLLWTSLL